MKKWSLNQQKRFEFFNFCNTWFPPAESNHCCSNWSHPLCCPSGWLQTPGGGGGGRGWGGGWGRKGVDKEENSCDHHHLQHHHHTWHPGKELTDEKTVVCIIIITIIIIIIIIIIKPDIQARNWQMRRQWWASDNPATCPLSVSSPVQLDDAPGHKIKRWNNQKIKR